jgi:hypothetical protein
MRKLSEKHIANIRKAIRFCPQGHEYTPENTRIYKGERQCRACGRAVSLALYHSRYRAQRIGNPKFLARHRRHDKSWRERNPKRYRLLAATAARKRRAEHKRLVFMAYGNKCKHCGFTDPRALQIDHTRGGGHKDRMDKKILSGDGFYKFILKMNCPKDRFQLLCANCNWIKRSENHEYRGSREPYRGTVGGDRRSKKFKALAVGV